MHVVRKDEIMMIGSAALMSPLIALSMLQYLGTIFRVIVGTTDSCTWHWDQMRLFSFSFPTAAVSEIWLRELVGSHEAYSVAVCEQLECIMTLNCIYIGTAKQLRLSTAVLQPMPNTLVHEQHVKASAKC
jgi:hypothetical protein